ncbi:flavin reductase family protein [Deinococcus radiomollis]|uniref:flavin reductase family protein n=1 Tax=Deinococcus radiomollis TaxID=468916 RepID=UPI003892A9A5
MHQIVNPSILYFGTPVVLISTLNPDGTTNLAPMSSAWWLNDSCMLGMSRRSQTVQNILREGRCVLNLPSADLVDAVDRLALTTGREDVPEDKAQMGYVYEPQKFGVAGLSAAPGESGWPDRVAECPVQMHAVLEDSRDVSGPTLAALEVRIVQTWMDDAILNPERRHHVDPGRWRPLIMSFTEFYGLGAQLRPSRLAAVF